MKMSLITFIGLLISLISFSNAQSCEKDCNGHGSCSVATASCICFEGWGANTDIAEYKASDCSERTCPAQKAWGDVPTSATAAHALAECSGRGTCDRTSGRCNCFPPFTGDACQRLSCANDCSGHGQCLPLTRLASLTNALPLSNPTTYAGFPDSTTWAEDMIFGCVCDSSWTVGLGDGERQEPEYHGPDCSLRHCPSSDDPRTVGVDETDCEGKEAKWSDEVGLSGNICHIDCSNRGLCDFKTGQCNCFEGYFGLSCNEMSALAKGG